MEYREKIICLVRYVKERNNVYALGVSLSIFIYVKTFVYIYLFLLIILFILEEKVCIFIMNKEKCEG